MHFIFFAADLDFRFHLVSIEEANLVGRSHRLEEVLIV